MTLSVQRSPRSTEPLWRIPFRWYSDPTIYEREQERIFAGSTWSYVGLAAEIPEPGDFKRTWIGERSVVMVRDRDQAIHVLANRCSHRGVELCREPFGNVGSLRCPYHQWRYALDGRLLGVPFRDGVDECGGMPDDFDMADHGLPRLSVTERNGVVFASFAIDFEPFESYLGSEMLGWFDRVFDGRPLTVLGYQRQRISANWKLMFDNIKEAYHAPLLHVFLVTFGLGPLATVKIDESGRHSVLVSQPSARGSGEMRGEMAALRADLQLHDPRILDPVCEFPGEVTVAMQSIWPNVVVQQQTNTLATRQLIPRGPDEHDLVWTFFGYEQDDENMRRRRLRQANLMGPGGYISVDDSEVMRLAHRGAASARDEEAALVEMGGRGVAGGATVTEAAVRALYRHYREVMDL